jgi:hypothetical protein
MRSSAETLAALRAAGGGKKNASQGNEAFGNSSRGQIRWAIWTAVGMPNRAMNLPCLSRTIPEGVRVANRRGSGFRCRPVAKQA